MKSKYYLFISALCLSLTSFGNISSSWANDQLEEAQYHNMEQMMGEIHLEKKQVELMIENMVGSGRITNEEGSKAKREIASMKEDDLENLKKLAITEVKNKRLLNNN